MVLQLATKGNNKVIKCERLWNGYQWQTQKLIILGDS